MQILRADHLGMCFGVRDAIQMAFDESRRRPVTILGDLVHNETVLTALRARGVRMETDPGRVATETVMITAHGASRRRSEELRRRGLQILEATCPLVHAAHRAVAALARAGYYPVIVGQNRHVEVCGLTEDLAECSIVLKEADVERLPARGRYGVAAQTTQPIERVRHLVELMRRRFPQAEVRFVDTVCQPTKLRQHAAEELARRCEVVIVAGGSHSNNTRELVETCRRHCPQVHHVQGPDDLVASWFDGVSLAGLTAGTSTPDEVIARVEQRLHELARELEAYCPVAADQRR